MTLNFQTTFDDFTDARTAHAAARRGKRWASGILLLGLAGLVVLLTVTTRVTPPPPHPSGFGAPFPTTAAARPAPPPPRPGLVESLLPLMPWLLIFIAIIRFLISQYRRPRGRFIDVTRLPGWQSLLDRYVPAVLIVCGLFAIVWSAAAQPGDEPGSGMMDTLLPLLPGAIVFVFLWLLVIRRVPRRLWNSNPSLERPKTVTADGNQFVVADELSTFVYRWPAIVRCVETPRQFLIYPGELSFHMVPKRAFATEADVNEFRSLVSDWASSRTGGFPVAPLAVKPLAVTGAMPETGLRQSSDRPAG